MTGKLLSDHKKRSEEVTIRYFEFLDLHLSELVIGVAMEMLELRDIASTRCISQKASHQDNTGNTWK